jgi:CRISPR-associated protein Cst2
MTLHVFASFVTSFGTASNNRGLTEGNITTLQKLLWEGQVHTTVSAESIRFALRRRLGESEPCNRVYDDATRANEWKDHTFSRWSPDSKETPFIDDDLLGYMSAEAAKDDASGESTEAEPKGAKGEKGKGKEKAKGTAKVRRAVLEVTRSVSLTPWPGDVTFNAASPGATPSAQKKGSNPVPYGTEMHATRYQYSIAMTPGQLRVPARAAVALRGLCALGEVAGNHGRFLFDFSPESVIFRLTQDPAPRILYSFRQDSAGRVSAPELLRRVRAGDIAPGELILGGALVEQFSAEERALLSGAQLFPGVVKACEAACQALPGGK